MSILSIDQLVEHHGTDELKLIAGNVIYTHEPISS
jgi:hypothetical protein